MEKKVWTPRTHVVPLLSDRTFVHLLRLPQPLPSPSLPSLSTTLFALRVTDVIQKLQPVFLQFSVSSLSPTDSFFDDVSFYKQPSPCAYAAHQQPRGAVVFHCWPAPPQALQSLGGGRWPGRPLCRFEHGKRIPKRQRKSLEETFPVIKAICLCFPSLATRALDLAQSTEREKGEREEREERDSPFIISSLFLRKLLI